MAVYDKTGNQLGSIYDKGGLSLSFAYNKAGTEIFSGEEPFVKTYVHYDTAFIKPNSTWIDNATTQRNAMLVQYQSSGDAIPIFIETDSHGHYNEGNKGCHNLAEPTMRYLRNIQLGDWGSFYSDGENAARHKETCEGITNYLPVIGNHELLTNNSAATEIADLDVLVDSFTPNDGILGSDIYGYYKVLDRKYSVKYLVFQPYLPCEWSVDTSGFIVKMVGDQIEWAINEMEANDGYDIVIVNHEPFPGTYLDRAGESHDRHPAHWKIDFNSLLMARKAKQSGSIIDEDGVSHSYDFRNCASDLLCALYGHIHLEWYAPKTINGFPAYVGNVFDNNGWCAYVLIDRANSKLFIYSFGHSAVNEVIELDL